MSLEEKLAQLGSHWFDRRGAGEVVAPMQDTFGARRPDFATASRHGLGHLTRVLGTEPVPADEGRAKLACTQRELVAHHRLGLPAIAHEECLTGVTSYGATVYPTPLAWGAAFDPELVHQVGSAIGRDLRRLGVHQGLGPVLDVVRDYRWGRVEETVGEDPYAVATITTAYVRGMEEQGVVATLKHFVGYSASRGGRNHAPVSVGPRELADVLLPPFEMAVREGGARSVMNSYADLDGEPVAASASLLTGLLRDTWGFEGTVVSDYWAVAFLATAHGVAADAADAGARSLRAGMDVELPNTMCFGELAPLVRDGRLDEALVDRAVRRVLLQKAQLGLLDAPAADGTPPGGAPDDDPIDLDPPANRDLARRLAEESVVLLANPDGVLPLDARPGRSLRRVAVVGPSAADPGVLLGCYSYPIHVLPRHPELGMGVDVPSLLDALRAELTGVEVVHEPGCAVVDDDRSGFDAAVRAARDADVCVLTVGDRAGMFGRGTSGEGCDAADLRLPGVQHELVEAVLATGTPVVLVVVSGRPYALGAYTGRTAAVVQAFMPGEEGAGAVAGVLSGRVTPSGKLPVQVPRDPGGGPQTYLGAPLTRRLDRISNLDPSPAFPFGHGLSYTTFRYEDLTVAAGPVPTDGSFEVGVTVACTGERGGTEVVQLYLSDPVADVAQPVRRLAGYVRVPLAAGESRRVTFTVPADVTAYTGADLVRVVDPGTIGVQVGGSSEGDDVLRAQVELTGPRRRPGADRALRTTATVTDAP
ncbi:glycosyl hydrolase [Cellulomonas shaoxiangyii]|uniref:Glycosyl hydrolase n=2 Tax=Cellulomonas shaoxiangyii TaxID=2566013 RepID=A0A4V1CN77_9CELL|nr:glycosyl hydrolase [Cellulomonas shaoxiangyii]TGY85128.1 glycosyl hydrolase [Cellulomonas shaoxiangyii]